MNEETKVDTSVDVDTSVEEADQGRAIITHMQADIFPLLKARSKECELPLPEEDKAVILDMYDALKKQGDYAVGLAAVQVGHPRRIFILRNHSGELETFVNPVITLTGSEVTKKEEGCLSLPGFFVKVPRPRKVVLRYNDTEGNLREQSFEGVMARAVCHEMDHLNGTLLSDRIEEVAIKMTRKTSTKAYAKKKRQSKARKKEKNRRNARKK